MNHMIQPLPDEPEYNEVYSCFHPDCGCHAKENVKLVIVKSETSTDEFVCCHWHWPQFKAWIQEAGESYEIGDINTVKPTIEEI